MKYFHILLQISASLAAKTTLEGIQALARNSEFRQLFSECQEMSRQTIRAIFHDATSRSLSLGNNGAVDGSIQFELESPLPNRLVADAVLAIQRFKSDNVTFADAFAFGSILAVKACKGPEIEFSIGRVDATHAGPPDLLFEDSGAKNEERIVDMGMTMSDLLVLVAGGHSVATVQSEASFDATPDILDNAFVSEMLQPRSAEDMLRVRIASDLAMAKDPQGRAMWQKFERKESLLHAMFAEAFNRLLNLGHNDLTRVKKGLLTNLKFS
jgi:catalase (peroxidase I)